MNIKLILMHLLTATLLFFTGCGGTGDTEGTGDDTNKIIARAETQNYNVRPNEEVFLTSSNSSIGEGTVTYAWLDTDGILLGTESTLTWNAPLLDGDYTIILVLNHNEPSQSTSSITISVKENLSPFASIQNLIQQSHDGTMQDVTYICIGDSTRVNTLTPDNLTNTSRHIFEDINASLQNYNVTSYLVAQGGLMFKTFNGDLHYTVAQQGRSWINVQDAIDKIPNDGATSIVDVSLGSNDYSALFHLGYTSEQIHLEIKSQMMRMITTIKSAKPQTKFLLTSTNPFQDWKIASDTYLNVYKEVAEENNLPLANFVDDIMPVRGSNDFKSWYLDGIHFNEAVGQPAVSSFVLEKILPTP